MNFLAIGNWSRLSKKYAQDEEALFRNKRNILFSQIAFLGTFMAIFHAVEDLVDGVWFLPMMDFTIALFGFAAYWINETGRHKLAKIFLLTFLNLFFFVYSMTTPKELGIYVFYFPWVAVAALVFEHEERAWRMFFIALSIVLLIMLFATDFNLLSEWRHDELMLGKSFAINILTSVAVTVVFILLMLKINEDSENKLRQLTKAIQQKNSDLQRSNEELDRFVYSASHDLKAPINSIKGLTHLAQKDCDDRKALTYFSRIESQTDRLGIFLLELFSYSRNRQTELRPEKIDMGAVIDEVMENLKYIDGAEKIEFKKYVRVDGDIRTDRVRLMVILHNLISNAIKYHNYDQKDPWVKVMVTKMNSTMQVMVADNGLGISDEFRDKVFEMFFRASDRPIGSGLGLFIVKETVEKMDGKILLSSNPGEGACFRIDLPLMA